MTYTISHDFLILIILLLILLYGTIKASFKQTLTIMLLLFIIDSLLGYPVQDALKFRLFSVLLSPLTEWEPYQVVTNPVKSFFDSVGELIKGWFSW